eukprot:XP_001693844.1 predicted protein [Chlamydomonas reinhardtii]
MSDIHGGHMAGFGATPATAACSTGQYPDYSSPFAGSQAFWGGGRQDAPLHNYDGLTSAGSAGLVGHNGGYAPSSAPSPPRQSAWGQPESMQARRESSVSAFGAAVAPSAPMTGHPQRQHQSQSQQSANGYPQPRYLPPAGQLAASGPSTAPFSNHGQVNSQGNGYGNQPYMHPRAANGACPGQFAGGPHLFVRESGGPFSGPFSGPGSGANAANMYGAGGTGDGAAAAEDAATLAIRRSILQREALLKNMEAQIL